MTIQSQAQLLEPGAYIELYEIDATALGGDMLRFHGYLEASSIWWQGKEFKAWPVQVEGFEVTGDGQQPQPTLSVANLDRSLTPLVAFLDDLIGAKFTRYKTLSKFLDARNFPQGNPSANPQEQFIPEVFYIHQKMNENSQTIEFSLRSVLDLDGTFLPRRQVVANLCTWLTFGGYRGPNCGYTGNVYTNESGQRITDPNKDVCPGTLAACKMKFGEKANLPYGGFPASSLVRT